MPFSRRLMLVVVALAIVGPIVGWAVLHEPRVPADFSLVNGAEPKSLDPAMVTGQPEGRVVTALFEGLLNWNSKTLEPEPGVAESWEISDDQLQYTLHLREAACWSDGSPVTAEDFRYSFRRFLDPALGAQYSYQLWYVKNAKRYTTVDLHAGDAVEIELREPEAGALPYARGKVIRGELLEIVPRDENGEASKKGGQSPLAAKTPPKGTVPSENLPSIYRVRVEGQERNFCVGGATDAEDCAAVLLDFNQVGVEVLDKRTLRLTLSEPTPYFLILLGFYPLSPVQQRCVETHGYPGWIQPENLVTNGPFCLQSRRIRDRIRLVKNPHYWDRDRVSLNTVDVLAVESPATALNLYLQGEVDWIPNVPPTVVPDLLAANREDYRPTTELTTYFYRIHVEDPPFNDRRVRQALAMALDKREVVTSVTRGGEQPAVGIVPPGMSGYEPPTGPGYDPDRARALLAEAGFPGGAGLPTITIMYNTDDKHQSIAEMIQDQWKRNLGVRVELENQEWGTYLARQQKKDYDICRAGWVADYADPNTFLDMFVTGGANNQTGWSNSEYDELIRQAASEKDPQERMRLLNEAESILIEECPVIPIYYRASTNMVRPYVRGFYPTSRDVHPLAHISIDPAEKERVLEESRQRP